MPAYYRAQLGDFVARSDAELLGHLAAAQGREGHTSAFTSQTVAWQEQITALRRMASHLICKQPNRSAWYVLIEYPIPRRQKRIDAVLLHPSRIYCLEFKTGDQAVSRAALNQVEDYALDLRDFHAASLGCQIVPVLVVNQARTTAVLQSSATSDLVWRPVMSSYDDLAVHIEHIESSAEGGSACPSAESWDSSSYRPVPTILEAAEALYAGHDVRDIASAGADPGNLTRTSEFLFQIVERARRNNEKVICIVTGVPGAGKTLAGLNLAHNPAIRSAGLPSAVFLSGNGPLVRVVSAALATSSQARSDARREVGTFIQNVHTYIRDALRSPSPPHEHIVIFDEAQRAWDATQVSRKFRQLRQRGFDVLGASFDSISESEMMLRVMDKHEGWAVLVALVGGGQEINDGEAGLEEWGRTLAASFPHWKVAASPVVLPSGPGLSGHRLFHSDHGDAPAVESADALHLSASVRSYRAESLAAWVDAVLAGDGNTARTEAQRLSSYPLVITRSLDAAKEWLHSHRRGERRAGLLASANALRLRAEGIELSPGFRGNKGQYENWFLNADGDFRSSNQLEVAASQFECQGLEIDWSCLCWGEDFLWQSSGGWCYSRLNGEKRGRVPREIKQRYWRNTYRVLLTRAREGMVLFVPHGDESDPTRPTALFDATARYLEACGVQSLG
ncbi:MAG: DUF2075 domain-containing protein [Verrucomicrobiaceae bacterium]|nr:DUF2075 domain-containing protein [Verrucomicrobiaceae bacterium]